MSDKTYHDLKNTLHRLELMAELLQKGDFTNFSEIEIREDVRDDLEKLSRLFAQISTDQ